MLKEKCQYFGICGGCVWQDLSLKDYIAKKESFITRAYQDAGFNQIPLEPMVLIPTGTRRRACFALKHGHLGFNQPHSHQIVEIQECPLLMPEINAVLPILRKTFQNIKLSGDVFVLCSESGIDIHLKTVQKQTLSLELSEKLTQLAQEPSIIRFVYNNTPLFEKIPLTTFADKFMQPSQEGEQALVQLVLDHIGDIQTAVDLFCGQGTFTKPLLAHHIQTIGYDSEASAVAMLQENGAVRDLFRSPLTTHELNQVNLVLLDPPRAGALAQITEIAKSTVSKVIMISCNPKTAARDSAILCQAGFNLQKIIPVDQFTYSNHIELVSIFLRS